MNVRLNHQSGCPIFGAKRLRWASQEVRLLLLTAAILAPAAHAQTKFIDPTPDELSMTSLPGYPGVSAVVLNKEEITKDDMHSSTRYERIKILNEDGKKYANVELSFVTTNGDYSGFGVGDDKTVDDIQGRTIHPDGTVIPFTGKPYLKVLEKGKGIKYQAKVFTLPDVTVGSIIEYHYATRINDIYYEPPVWIIQSELFVKSAHFVWYPTSRELHEDHGIDTTITWFPILPKDAQIKQTDTPGVGAYGLPQRTYDLTMKDVPPLVDEEYMPPVRNYSYRVYWNFIPEHDAAEFWKSRGKDWSRAVNSFVGPHGEVKSATQQIIAGATTQDQKLRAIYAAVQKFENTDFTRAHEQREDKANGLGKLNNTDDVFKRERGDSLQLTELFIAMARAAGLNADAMMVPDRSQEIFIPQWLNLGQFDEMIAVVNVDGKDQFFDPGERYCPYGRLAWEHTYIDGLRQKGNETAFDKTPADGFRANGLDRIANLKMDSSGQITGHIDFAYTGAPALRLRHSALSGDDESLKHQLRSSLEEIIPHSLEVKDVTVANVADYENPLKVTYTVEGTLGTWTGKRLVLPADIFFANEKATFPHEKRDVAVDFNFPRQIKDALRIVFPSNFTIEATPNAAKYSLLKFAVYGMNVEPSTSWFTTRREYDFAEIFVLPEEYPQLRTFYSQFEANDQQSVVLKSTTPATTTASSATPAAN